MTGTGSNFPRSFGGTWEDRMASPLVSIIISNYNYGRFLGDSIESALALEWENKEVIVVDDGSTDTSREVITSFGSKVVGIYKENGGQTSAANAGFQSATGDVIFFLDSDDLLLPKAAKAVVDIFQRHPGVSRVQFPMFVVGENGEPSGAVYPNFSRNQPPDLIRRSLLETTLYPTSPTSGGAWSRDFLRRVFPLPVTQALRPVDSYLIVSAPLFGDVITLQEPLAKFRIHGENSWAQQTYSRDRVSFYCEQEQQRTAFLVRIAASRGITIAPDKIKNNIAHMMSRLASWRLSGTHPFPDDTRMSLYLSALKALRSDLMATPRMRAMLLIWFTGVAFLPLKYAEYLVKIRFVPNTRPKLVTNTLRYLGILRGRS
jgi:glycosyltransferase involved in cell wall biosynthesis